MALPAPHCSLPQAGQGPGLNLNSLSVQMEVGKDQTDKESVITDSYGESYGSQPSPDPQDYYGRWGGLGK